MWEFQFLHIFINICYFLFSFFFFWDNNHPRRYEVVSHCSFGLHLAQRVKHLSAMQETQVWALGWEDPLEKEMVHIGHLPTCRVHLSVSYLFAFSYCSWCSQGKNPEVVCHSLLQWTTFVRTLHYDPSVLGGPTWHGLQFHWVRQDCGLCDQFG